MELRITNSNGSWPAYNDLGWKRWAEGLPVVEATGQQIKPEFFPTAPTYRLAHGHELDERNTVRLTDGSAAYVVNEVGWEILYRRVVSVDAGDNERRSRVAPESLAGITAPSLAHKTLTLVGDPKTLVGYLVR